MSLRRLRKDPNDVQMACGNGHNFQKKVRNRYRLSYVEGEFGNRWELKPSNSGLREFRFHFKHGTDVSPSSVDVAKSAGAALAAAMGQILSAEHTKHASVEMLSDGDAKLVLSQIERVLSPGFKTYSPDLRRALRRRCENKIRWNTTK